ncbi:MAG: hypothetical protein JW832_06560 [Deltaproteobacteria bacterium]|nr:hypothetical protein [Deltaproteobacteria bacterium]
MISSDTPRFVAHLDMLGMSSLTKANPTKAWEMLSRLDEAKKKVLDIDIEIKDTGELIVDRVRTFTFSDTIILYSRGNSEHDAIAMFSLSNELLYQASLFYSVPLRGGIALGQFWFNEENNLFSGPALVEAYEIGECSQWIGVCTQNEAAKEFTKMKLAISERGGKTIVPWSVPQKKGKIIEQQVLNWPETYAHDWFGPVPLTIDVFYRQFEDTFGPYESLPQSVKSKYENTVNFFNANFMAYKPAVSEIEQN